MSVTRQKRLKKKPSVQRQYVRVQAIEDGLLRLAVPGLSHPAYVCVVRVDGGNFDFQDEETQHLLFERYRTLLRGLRLPLQILSRIQPANVDGYLQPYGPFVQSQQQEEEMTPLMRVQRQRQEVVTLPEPSLDAILEELLARAHVDAVRQLAERQTMLQRSLYIAIRSRPISSMYVSWRPGARKRASNLEEYQAKQEVQMACEELLRMLQSMGLVARHLQQPEELLRLYASCLAPLHTFRWPLTEDQGKMASQLQADALADLLAPAAVTMTPDYLRIEEEYACGIRVTHLPRVVVAGWLRPLFQMHEWMDICEHLFPLETSAILPRFRRQRTQHHSSIAWSQEKKGTEGDPEIKIAAGDLDSLIDQLASGEERMLTVSLFLIVRASSREELEQRTQRVRTLLQSLLMRAHVALYQQDRLYRSCLPHALNELEDGAFPLDATSAATMFPFFTQSLFHQHGILEGVTVQGDPILFDAWGAEMPNANRLVLGPPGCGKSYHIKSSLLRMALRTLRSHRASAKDELPFQVITIDPEREYERETAALGGQIIRLAPGSPHAINPFDLPSRPGEHGDLLADHIQRLHTLLEIMLADRTPQGPGRLHSAEKGLLDRALYEAYRRVGITTDVKTHDRPAPLLRDLFDVLESEVCGLDPTGLVHRLRRYVHGSLSGLFAHPTNVELHRVAVTFDIHDLETELRPIGLFLVSNFVWTVAFRSQIPRQFIVDEAATLYQYETGALFLEDLVRRARKHYLGVTIISQHPQLFHTSAIPANCATHVFMRQDASTLDLLKQMFQLSAQELQTVRRLKTGEALFLVGEQRFHVRFVSNELEHVLATTNPAEFAALEPRLRTLLQDAGYATWTDAILQRLFPVDVVRERERSV